MSLYLQVSQTMTLSGGADRKSFSYSNKSVFSIAIQMSVGTSV